MELLPFNMLNNTMNRTMCGLARRLVERSVPVYVCVQLGHAKPIQVTYGGVAVCGCRTVARVINFILFTPLFALSSIAKIFLATILSYSTDSELVILVSLTVVSLIFIVW